MLYVLDVKISWRSAHTFPRKTGKMLIHPESIAAQTGSLYPEQFQSVVAGRYRKRLGDAAGLKNFGVHLTKLAPGSCSALRHWHTQQDEFIYVLEREVTLVTNEGEQILTAGMAAGFPAGVADGHHLINRSNSVVLYLEIGDRTPNDEVNYPDVDLFAKSSQNSRVFSRKDGSLYTT